MNKAAIEEKLKAILEDCGLNLKQLEPNASFRNDLGLNSLDFVELILTVEQIFDISISFENDNMDTIGDLLNTIKDCLDINHLKKNQF